jgi:putative peptide zinc metalloprotease protein
MTLSLRRLAVAAVLAVALLAAAAPGAALAQDNSAVAVNTKDGSSLFKLAFSIKQVGGEVVDQTNAAVAYSNCTECQTVAIAIQVLIVTAENPDVVTPTNLAIAVNENCDTCTTMALAYQFVVGGAGLELTAKGRQELARIRHELLLLGKQGLSAAEIRDRTQALVDQLKQVLATELKPKPEPGSGGFDQGGDNGGDNGGQQPDGQQQQTTPDQSTETTPTQTPTQTAPAPQSTTPQDTTPQSTTPQPQSQQPPAGDTTTTP